jgi:hypothetical protein
MRAVTVRVVPARRYETAIRPVSCRFAQQLGYRRPVVNATAEAILGAAETRLPDPVPVGCRYSHSRLWAAGFRHRAACYRGASVTPPQGSPVLSKLAYLTLCRSVQLLTQLARGDAAKDLELLVLRHQLIVRRRQTPRPRLEPADRALLAAISRVLGACWPSGGCSCAARVAAVGDTAEDRPLRRFAEPGQRGGAALWRTTSSARSRCRPGREVAWERAAAILSSRMVTALAPT